MTENRKIIRYIPAFKTKREWEQLNPTPLMGEWLTEIDTNRWKLGDGLSAYRELPYAIQDGEKGDMGPIGPRGATGARGAAGVTFTPSVGPNGVVSWTNDSGLPNPAPAELRVYAEDMEAGEEQLEFARRMVGVSHLVDQGKDLIADGGNLYRSKLGLIDGNPHMIYENVGYVKTNDAIFHTVASTASKVLLFFKVQSDGEGYLLLRSGEEKNMIALQVGQHTKHYVIPLEFEAADSRQLTILTVAVYGKAVRMWDFAEKEG